jgi:hypothetical protein
VTALAVRRYRRNRLSYEVLTRLVWFPAAALDPAASQGARKQKAVLELLQDGEVVDVQQVELAPGQAIEKIYGNLSGAGRKIEARLRLEGAVDVLGLDDRAFAVLPERRTQRVLLVTAGNLFLEGALLATGAGEENHVKIERIKPAAYTPALAEAYDVVVFDAVTAKAPANTHVLYLHPEGDACPFAIAGVVKAPIITDVDASHPVMRWVALGDVNMMKSAVFNPQPGDRVLASMLKQPLMVARQETTLGGVRRSVAIGMDLRQSDLPLRVAFPVLLMNALDWFAGDVDDDMGSRKTGQFWRIPLRKLGKDGKAERVQVRAGATAVLVRPDGVPLSVPVSEGFALHYGQKVGFYEIRSDEAGARQFAANLSDPNESQIRIQRELSIGGVKLAAPAPGEQALKRTLWPYLLLLVMAIFALEWWSYHRRVTV